ncbi:MAG: HD domain-containing protein, partial [Firmicutes bacterium]|nr:HD domain-containing protein [Bacillota bacterium]
MIPAQMRRYMWLVDGLGAAVLLLTAHKAWTSLSWPVLLFAAAVFWAMYFAVVSVRGKSGFSVLLPILFTASIVLSPAWGAWLGALAAWSQKEVKKEVPLFFVLFNRMQLALTGWIGGAVFLWLGGSIRHFSLAADGPAIAMAAVLAFIVNVFLVTQGAAFSMKLHLRDVLRMHVKSFVAPLLMLIPLGYALVFLYLQLGWVSFAYFIIPLLALRAVFGLVQSLRNARLGNMKVALASLGLRDPYTYGHSVRVAQYGVLLARHMNLAEQVVETVWQAGLLHDVGKIGVPDNVLRKAGRLTDDEFCVMRKHTEMGHYIVQQMDIGEKVEDSVLHHHERWDGNGYPHFTERNK